ncbi:teichoic acid biosynthesis protein C [Nonomuraea longispora]|uniref:Teichoic acid biosynthesis protein C n=1 Tax=Nonomuraea longispora TaxID=1848320 RepID=A0A4R4NHW7_9ACTN|nr:teichoic acid biosynthesis protein C [Nonomuraea longispora]
MMSSHMPVTRRGLLRIGAGAALTAVAGATTASAAAAAWAGGRFQLTAPSSPLIWRKALRDETVLQSFSFDNDNGHIYTVQVKNGGGSNAAGDLCLTKLSLSGSVLGHMYLMGFGHGVQIGVEPSGSSAYLWTETDAVSDGDSARGSRLARFKFVNGQTLTRSSSALTKFSPISGAVNTTCATDPSTGRLVMRYHDGSSFRFAVFSLAALKSGSADPIHDVPQMSGLGTFQGYAPYGDYVYILTGNAYSDDNPPPGNSFITCLDLRTGDRVQRARTEAGRSLDFREPEGMAIQLTSGGPRLCLGLASGVPKARKASIFYKTELI